MEQKAASGWEICFMDMKKMITKTEERNVKEVVQQKKIFINSTFLSLVIFHQIISPPSTSLKGVSQGILKKKPIIGKAFIKLFFGTKIPFTFEWLSWTPPYLYAS